MAFDAHVNFGYSTVLIAPTPALSGLTLTVQAGDGSKFPSPSFNAVVWPPGVQGTLTNAEIVRVTGISTDTFTITRLQESSNNRAIAIGDQICCVLSAKTLTDIENRVISVEKAWVDDFRVTLTSGTPVTTTDVTAATTIYLSPLLGNQIDLPDSAGSPLRFTTGELSIAVPATTATMYDVFVYNNGGTPTLELLAWTNDSTRATAVVRTTNGRLLKSGDNTRMYVASCRTTGISGQTEDSVTKRYVWNYYNRRPRTLRKTETTASWSYSTAAWRYANNSSANQVEVVVGIAETMVTLTATGGFSVLASGAYGAVGIGEDSSTVLMPTASLVSQITQASISNPIGIMAFVTVHPTIGRHFYAFIENGFGNIDTFYGNSATNTAGLIGTTEG